MIFTTFPIFPMIAITTLLAQAAQNVSGTFFGLGIFGLLLAVVLALFWVWMLIDALTNTHLDAGMKLIWAAAIFFLPFLGALAYLFIGRRPRSSDARS